MKNKWLSGIWKFRSSRWACIYICLLIIVSLMANWLASDATYSLIQQDPNHINATTQSFQPPGFVEESGIIHLLGTDKLGRDVASRLIHGTRSAISIGIISSLISLIIALILGVLSGYFGNREIHINWLQAILLVLAVVFGGFYANEYSIYINTLGEMEFSLLLFVVIFVSVVTLIGWLVIYSRKWPIPQFFLPADIIVMKIIEVFKAVPSLFFLLAVFAIVDSPSLVNVILVIGFLGWPRMTRLLRAEVKKVKEENFIHSARVLGESNIHIVIHHVLPNALGPLIVALAYNISSAVLIESSLSFLGIGLPQDQASWGQMLNEARLYFPAWWLAACPGFLIFTAVLSFNVLGNRLNQLNSPL